ncbi:hypothetical protein EPA93_35470 [Ktedonosporobacter rubrisoli]|uniref:DUF8166 domain-containing protein n=1 Tax=Ktedonosporobacter rubrisoli TaxID=2509675 RepID=A0A4P6K0Q2_KTERU|nr:hypothetical protein [Ktedonosporobacter rubrisoli]QBD80986.1 hypothetical protein EPA93_35470 [Ktedonosporobacter rubrisoli]
MLGKIVKSDSHINYVCQIHGPHEVEDEPAPVDYAFGRFVRVAIRTRPAEQLDSLFAYAPENRQEPTSYAVGVIYDTILLNPAFGSLGPRLSNESQVELFSPDYIAEKAVLIYIMMLGMVEIAPDAGGNANVVSVTHGIPLVSLELGSEVETMSDEEVSAFHYFRDPVESGRQQRYLHMGYLPHILTQRSSLLPMVTLRIIDQLERLFPQNLALLSIVKRNFAWRLKVETTG